jgi:hypothetical protein
MAGKSRTALGGIGRSAGRNMPIRQQIIGQFGNATRFRWKTAFLSTRLSVVLG